MLFAVSSFTIAKTINFVCFLFVYLTSVLKHKLIVCLFVLFNCLFVFQLLYSFYNKIKLDHLFANESNLVTFYFCQVTAQPELK